MAALHPGSGVSDPRRLPVRRPAVQHTPVGGPGRGSAAGTASVRRDRTPPPTWTTDTVPPYGDGRQPANGNGYQSLPPIPTEQVPQHGLGATAPGGTDATTSPDNSGTTTGRGVLLGRGFLIGVPPAGAVRPGHAPPGPPRGRPGPARRVPRWPAGSESRWPSRPSESLPSALSARGAQPVDLPSPATQATAADGPMGSPVSAAIGWQQALSARATMPPPAAAGDPRSGRSGPGCSVIAAGPSRRTPRRSQPGAPRWTGVASPRRRSARPASRDRRSGGQCLTRGVRVGRKEGACRSQSS